jgi:predicted acylesterase/phospholipase RssA
LAVVTIQGGGIYGLNLLGQLSYLTEELKIVPVAVAGNSAGSIVAALYWAGYAPYEIRNIFAEMAEKKVLTALVGPFVPEGAAYTLADFRSLKNDCERLVDQNLAGDPPAGMFRRAARWISSPFRGMQTLLALRGIRNRLAPHFATRGCFLGDEFTGTIDKLIRRGPLLRGREHLPTGQPLEFGDLRRLIEKDRTFNPPALFLTATNVTGRKLEVFNSIDERYDRVPIAKTS